MEAKFLKMCKQVAQQTDNNDHTGAKLTVAKYFKLNYFVRIFEFVEFLHTGDGAMLSDLSSIRRRSGIAMMAILQEQLTEDQYSQLDKSF
jgi:hypothetical protein